MKMKLLFLAAALVFSRLTASAQSNPDSTNATDVELELAWPDGAVYTSAVHDMETIFGLYAGDDMTAVNNVNWQAGAGGTGEQKKTSPNPPPYLSIYDYAYYWGAGQWPGFGDGYYISLPSDSTNETSSSPYWPIHDQYASSYALYGEVNFETLDGNGSLNFNDQSEISLITGGDAASADLELYAISGTAIGITFTDSSLPDGIQEAIPPEQIQIGSLGSLTATSTNDSFISGTLYAVLPKHKTVPITPQVQGAKYREAVVSAQAYPLVSQCVATTPANRVRTTVGVGEQVALFFTPMLPTNAVWSASTGSLNLTVGPTNLFTAPSNAANVTVTAEIFGKSVNKSFTVVEPSGIDHAQIVETNHYAVNIAGVGMQTIAWVAPTNVSFYRVNIMEVGEDATNISGYFAQWTAQQLRHATADHWSRLNSLNQFTDEAYHYSFPEPWSSGGFTWDIPAKWQVVGSNATNAMKGWNQKVLIDALGTMTVQKFSHSVTRTTNDIITVQ